MNRKTSFLPFSLTINSSWSNELRISESQYNYLNKDLHGEHCGEYIVKICQHLKDWNATSVIFFYHGFLFFFDYFGIGGVQVKRILRL